MAALSNPNLFSSRFGIVKDALSEANLIDPILNCDTRLFVDPLLLDTSKNKLIRRNGHKLLEKRFKEIVSLVAASKVPGDVAWRNAAKLLALEERPETGLGYGGSSTSGSSRPDEIRQKVLATTKEIITLGDQNPEIISLMGLFEEGIGPDTISDLSTNIIFPVLCEITELFCKKYKVTTEKFENYYDRHLPRNPCRKDCPVVLVPKDIVRHLPLAVDWSDVSRVIQEVKEIRESFNRYVGSIAQSTVTEKKKALRKAALESLSNFKALFEAFVSASNYYDPNKDILNYYAFRDILTSDPAAFADKIAPPSERGSRELRRIVDEIIVHFRNMVEHNNMWELVWDGRRAKRERASQLLFFAIADMFCKANDLDISPETNMGGGPVDFKFSRGYSKRILVEIKLSKGTVVHGYEKQLEVYKDAAKTADAVFIIMNVGSMGSKLTKIKRIRDARLNNGERASDIEVIDARRQKSASKR